DKEQNNYLHQLLSRQRSDIQHPSLCDYARRKAVYPTTTGVIFWAITKVDQHVSCCLIVKPSGHLQITRHSFALFERVLDLRVEDLVGRMYGTINYVRNFECGQSLVCFLFIFFVKGSLPPSPADSGVSDVDSSSSGHTSTDELKARLQPSIHSPVGGLFSRHPALTWNAPLHQHNQRQSHLGQQFYQPFTTSKSYIYGFFRHLMGGVKVAFGAFSSCEFSKART
ncbi:hypothetical protein D910_02469, partial [Dendroctonus ponderosae]